MFHEGDLQSGIALALQESKRVICFVSGRDPRSRRVMYANADNAPDLDDEEESKTWENEYLADEEVREERYLFLQALEADCSARSPS